MPQFLQSSVLCQVKLDYVIPYIYGSDADLKICGPLYDLKCDLRLRFSRRKIS